MAAHHALLALALSAAAPPVPDPHVALDQFGYRPGDEKVAVLRDPRTGYDAPSPYLPGPTIEVRRASDDGVAWSGAPVAWRAGATHVQSGDGAWWVDFSGLTTPGTYYLFDPARGIGSGAFDIGEDVYRSALRHAVRSFYYQRCGVARTAAAAGTDFADPVCHTGSEQDLDCRAVLDTRPATSRDLSGGWHDAGDYNKYINFADDPVHDLIAAYEQAPGVWDDDLGIPESGNCIPDVLDELRHELEWMLRMQLPDGSVLHKVSVTDFSAGSPPSTDTAPRRYAEATASATISACGAFAHAARVYRAFGWDTTVLFFVGRLEDAAIAAWDWLEANPGAIPSAYDNRGFMNVAAEDPPYEQEANRVAAAVRLYTLTRDPAYRAYVDANYDQLHLLQWGFAYPFEAQYQDALLEYAADVGATPAVAAAIRDAYRGSMAGAENRPHITAGDDVYRAFLADADHTWGSNRTKSAQGSMYRNMLVYGLDPATAAVDARAAAGYLHYVHGVNPVGLVFLSAMEGRGAERSVSEFYHSWFGDGTRWDSTRTSPVGPAPGFLTGGVNPSYAPDAAYTGPPIVPPESQPVQKSYRDWNAGWPENSWEVTENQVAYQATYVKLLAAHAGALPPLSTPASPGGSLRAVRRGVPPVDVELSWAASSGATSYDLLRCDAAARRPCAPLSIATPGTPPYLDAAPVGTALWYTVYAVNGCGRTP